MGIDSQRWQPPTKNASRVTTTAIAKETRRVTNTGSAKKRFGTSIAFWLAAWETVDTHGESEGATNDYNFYWTQFLLERHIFWRVFSRR